MPKMKFSAVGGYAKADLVPLEEEYARSVACESVRVGDTHLFWKALLFNAYLPIASITWAYLRREDSSATVCCGRTTFSDIYLLLHTGAGSKHKLSVASMEVGEAILALLRERCPEMDQGYYPELAARHEAGQE